MSINAAEDEKIIKEVRAADRFDYPPDAIEGIDTLLAIIDRLKAENERLTTEKAKRTELIRSALETTSSETLATVKANVSALIAKIDAETDKERPSYELSIGILRSIYVLLVALEEAQGRLKAAEGLMRKACPILASHSAEMFELMASKEEVTAVLSAVAYRTTTSLIDAIRAHLQGGAS